MADLKRFAIQRDDDSWYAGRAADGSADWTLDCEQAHVFASYPEAMAVLNELRQAGHQVRLFALG